MKILLVDDGDGALAPVAAALRAAGHDVRSEVESARRLLKQVDDFQPDVVLIDTDSPGRDVLEQLCVLTAHNPLPLVMFSGDSSTQSIAAATEAGVTAYISQRIDVARLEVILAVAKARFQREQKLREQLACAVQHSEERKLTDTAKGMLMATHAITEEEAYRRLQQASMEQGVPMWRIAERILRSLG